MANIERKIDQRILSFESDYNTKRERLQNELETINRSLAVKTNPQVRSQLLNQKAQLEEELAKFNDRDDAVTQELITYLLNATPILQNYYSEVERVHQEMDAEKPQVTSNISTIYNQYLINVEGRKDIETMDHKIDYTLCPNCKTRGKNVRLILDSHISSMICPECAIAQEYLGNTMMNVQFDENRVKTNTQKYEKVDHFRKKLEKIEGKVRMDPPAEVVDAVVRFCIEHRITKLNEKMTRNILQKLKLPKFYDHRFKITNIINKQPLPQFTQDQKEKLINMFKEAEIAYMKCPVQIKGNRTNMLGTQYCGYKFCQILGWEEYLQYFQMLKGKPNLRQHEKIFQWICQNKDGEKWKFEPTLL
jgi:hypothetical protein